MDRASGQDASSSLLARLSGWSRSSGAPSLTRARAGRLLGRLLGALGVNTVVEVHTEYGWLVLDARSRTESSELWSGLGNDDDIAFLRTVTSPGATFMDIGANVGLVLVPVMSQLDARGLAIAVEPITVNVARLTRAVELNAPRCRVSLHEVALGSNEGELRLVKEGPGPSSGNAVPVVADETGVAVRQTTLDHLCAELGLESLDTIKIDVEGFEVEVFRGASDTLRRFRPLVYGEFNNGWMPQRGVTFHDAWAMFAPLDYRCFSFTGRLRLVERINPPHDLGNVVLIPEEKVQAVLSAGVTLEKVSE
jgi:FkbM family methyltransferase